MYNICEIYYLTNFKMKLNHPILLYPFNENYNSKKEDKQEEMKTEEQKFEYWFGKNGEIIVQLPEVIVIWETLKRKFEWYVQDPEIKSWLDKIFTKLSKDKFSKEYKKYESMDISKEFDDIFNRYPRLWLEISWNLWLPSKATKFSDLTTTEKMNFNALYRAVNDKMFFEKNSDFTTEKVYRRIKEQQRRMLSTINSEFERKNYANFLNLEDTLADFWLTESERKKMQEYLLFIKDHPEMLWTEYELASLKQEAGIWWYLIVLVIGLAIGIGIWLYVDNIWRPDPEKTTILNWTTEIKNPEKILNRLTQKAEFTNSWERKVEMYKKNDNDSYIKTKVKELINKVQKREIQMELSWDLCLKRDPKKFCKMEVKSNGWKWVLYLTLAKPDVIVLNDKVNILNEDTELVQVSQFKQTQEELRQELIKKAIEDAKADPNFYEKWKNELKNQLLDICSTVKPYGLEIEDVVVEVVEDVPTGVDR